MRDDCLNSKINPRAAHFRRKRRTAEAFRSKGYPEMARRLEDCQEVNRQIICIDCGHVHYVEDKCLQRVCPLCSYVQSRERGDYIVRMCRDMKFPKMMTLTMPRWKENPGEGIDYLRRCFNLLRISPCFKKVLGGVYQIELKPKVDGWHIHIHVILDSPYLPYQHIYTAWKSILGLPHADIDIKAAKTEREQIYVAKYASKAADYEGDIEKVVEWYEATKGHRLFASFGTWYNKEPEEATGDCTEPREAFACPYCGNTGSCVSGENIGFIVGKDAFSAYRNALTAAGPPRVSRW